MKRKNIFLLFISFIVGLQLHAQSILINEIMQSNIDYLMVDNDFPDSWVELYNPSEKDIDIYQYRLGLTDDYEAAYQIKRTTIVPAHGYVVIYCDKVGSGLHTDFRLESGKDGNLYLFNSKGTIVDALDKISKMPAPNIAYGRIVDGASNWQYEVTPTAGSANNSIGASKVLPDAVFSLGGGVMTTPVSVTISMPAGDYPKDTKLYVTTDGSEPIMESMSGESFTFDISETTVLRAKLISEEALTPRAVTHSYIYHPRETKLPIISIITDNDFLFDNELGIFSNDTLKGNNKPTYAYDYRRPMNVEYFDMRKNGEEVINQLGETAIQGGATRKYPQKSMKLYANKRFGEKRFNGNFWYDKPEVTQVKSFIIRNGGNNCIGSRINDAMIQKLFGTHVSNIDWQAYQPVILYINGIYKGEFGMRERSDEDYVEANYDGLEDIEITNHGAYYNTGIRNKTAFKDFYALYSHPNTTLDELKNCMDIENFCNVFMAELFSNNIDFPHNNVSMWRSLENGKWKWILKDLDFLNICPASYDMFKYMLVDGEECQECIDAKRYSSIAPSLKLYRKMVSFPDFSNMLIDKFSVFLGDFLKPSKTVELINLMESEIINEIKPTFTAYANMTSMSYYNQRIASLKEFMRQRPAFIYQQMADYFNLGDVVSMNIKTNQQAIDMNGIGLTEGDFDGAYFSNKELNLAVKNSECSWRMHVKHKDGNTTDYEFCDNVLNLMLSDYYDSVEDSISVCFETYKINETDFDRRIAELGIDTATLENKSNSPSPTFDEPSCVFINLVCEDGLPVSKGDVKTAAIEMYDNNGSFMRKNILLDQQGSNANNLHKQNLTISFVSDNAEDMDVTFGTWVPQNEFYLKAFYNDGMRGTAEIAYKLYSQMIGAQEGARMTGDAFPCMVYVNGNFLGLYAWQLKKHRKNMDLAKDDSKQVWLDGTLNDKQLFHGDVNWTKFEVRNPKDLYNMDGSEYDGDNPQELMDEESTAYEGKKKQVRCAEAKAEIIQLSKYHEELVSKEDDGASAEEMRKAISKRFDVDGLVKYMVFSLVTNNYDGFSKSWQWYTRDGKMWTVAPYDCELTFGYNDDDTSKIWDANKGSKKYDYRMENVDSNGPMLWIKKYFWDDVKSEYAAQRANGVVSVDNIMSIVNDWYGRIAEQDWNSEFTKWSMCPVSDSPERMEEWITNRIEMEDKYMEYFMTYDIAISDAKWATVCLPFGFDVPEGVDAYSVEGVESDGKTLVKVSVQVTEANKPYLLNGEKGVYSVSGTKDVADTSAESYLKNGILIGTYSDIYAPEYGYVLQAQDTGTGFFKVSQSGKMLVGANHAYLYLEGNNHSYEAKQIMVDDMDATAICNVREDIDTNLIFSVNGIENNSLKKGLNIVKYNDGSVKKIIIK